MEREAQLKYCKVCNHKEHSIQYGLVCGLTGERATFTSSCTYFEPNEELVNKSKEQKAFEKNADIGYKRAIRILGLMLFLSVLGRIASYFFEYYTYLTIIKDIFITGLELSMYAAILKGKEWAKTTLTTLLVIGIGAVIFDVVIYYDGFIDIIASLIPIAVWSYAIYFLNFDVKFLNFMRLKYR